MRDGEGAREDGASGILPSDLLFLLAVTETESAEEGPGVTLDEPGKWRDGLTGRLEALGAGEAVEDPLWAHRQPL